MKKLTYVVTMLIYSIVYGVLFVKILLCKQEKLLIDGILPSGIYIHTLWDGRDDHKFVSSVQRIGSVIYNRRQVVWVIRLDHLTFPAETEDSHLFTHQPLKRG